MLNAIASAFFGLTLLTPASASGAVIAVSASSSDGRQLIIIDGALTRSDGEKFAKIAARIHSAVVSFNSNGGNLWAGIEIGDVIKSRRFDTMIADGKSCASACALAWLAGDKRFIVGTGKVGFHAAYDAVTGRETGVGNALVGAYVAKLGLSYLAVVYITKASPSEMTWLNISDAAALGIRVAFASPVTPKTIVTLPTRFGDIDIVKPPNECCDSQIRYKSSAIDIFLNEHGYANLEAVFRVSAGDLLVISTPSNVRGMTPSYYAVLVTPQYAADISGDGFGTADWTFRFKQIGDEVQFDLGYENRRKKSAVYRNGAITVRLEEQSHAILPKVECAKVLNMAAECPKIETDCTESTIWDKFAMAGQRYFNSLEQMPVFSTEKFYQVCQRFCSSKAYSLQTARAILCGY